MADVLTLGSIDLFDRTKYDTTEPDEPDINIERTTQAGCGGRGTKVIKRQVSSYDIPLVVWCRGSTPNAAFTNRNSLFAELNAAVMNANGPDAKYLTRNVDDQSVPDVWRVFDYDSHRIRKDLDKKKHVGFAITLHTYPGQLLPEGL